LTAQRAWPRLRAPDRCQRIGTYADTDRHAAHFPTLFDDNTNTRATSIFSPFLLLMRVGFGSYTVLDLFVPTIAMRRLMIAVPAVLIVLALITAVLFDPYLRYALV
jgi:hypothetical protein